MDIYIETPENYPYEGELLDYLRKWRPGSLVRITTGKSSRTDVDCVRVGAGPAGRSGPLNGELEETLNIGGLGTISEVREKIQEFHREIQKG